MVCLENDIPKDVPMHINYMVFGDLESESNTKSVTNDIPEIADCLVFHHNRTNILSIDTLLL